MPSINKEKRNYKINKNKEKEINKKVEKKRRKEG
jgi:hypothetical protein